MLFLHCCFNFSWYGVYICKNWLASKVLQKPELSLSHACLTGLEKECGDNETFS